MNISEADKERLAKTLEAKEKRIKRLLSINKRSAVPQPEPKKRDNKFVLNKTVSNQSWPFKTMEIGDSVEFDRSIAKKVRSACSAYVASCRNSQLGRKKTFLYRDTGVIFVVKRLS